jgi:hypothetical protein
MPAPKKSATAAPKTAAVKPVALPKWDVVNTTNFTFVGTFAAKDAEDAGALAAKQKKVAEISLLALDAKPDAETYAVIRAFETLATKPYTDFANKSETFKEFARRVKPSSVAREGAKQVWAVYFDDTEAPTPKPAPAKKAAETKPAAKPVPAKATKPATDGGLRKPQLKILAALAGAKVKKPIARKDVAALAGVDNAGCTEWIGSSDPVKRAANDAKHFPSLVTLGFVSEHKTDVEGKDATAYAITDAGRKALKAAE